MNPPRVGVGVVITRGNEVLLIHRHGAHGAGTWSSPGGHLDFGEAPEQCAVREAREETGVEVTDVRFRALTNDLFEAEGRHYVTIWFDAVHWSGDAGVRATREIAQVGWFGWDRLPAPLFLPLQNLLAGRCFPAPSTAAPPAATGATGTEAH